jgi:hypothetical protein
MANSLLKALKFHPILIDRVSFAIVLEIKLLALCKNAHFTLMDASQSTIRESVVLSDIHAASYP